MMSSTLGAPLGGTTRGGHQDVESVAASLITPPNFGGGGGICLPLMVVVAPASPNVPVTTCADALPPAKKLETASAPKVTFRNPAPKSTLCLLASPSGLPSVGGLRWVARAINPPTCFASDGYLLVGQPIHPTSSES